MNIIGEAEAAIETATGARWFRVALNLAPWLAIAALGFALFATRATLARVRLEHTAELVRRDRDDARVLAANADRVSKAVETYATRTAALQPLIVRSTDTVRTYAETPAGRAACLDADRVRGLDELDASLANPTAAAGDDPVPTDAGAPPAGR